ncbi:hypothetical protein [Sporolactobacillus laevolacticus]|uniref:Uncharacterized protein n=1 Tax=Sporolactobacillus laevolacticus DSM 442 TaxID=1395513 RepID=V6IXF9_9BACL|nr:hypothetical protein [Sporolactobacillus laevolacticus]EST12027.1 hypothetical protein P343_07740 [Sporolactobacillus laevolacticus DSM 442]
MSFIVPFQYKDIYAHKEYTVFAVNEDQPEKRSGYVQGYWRCTHCGEGNQFRLYDDAPNHIAKCPKCRKEFIAVEEIEEDFDDE